MRMSGLMIMAIAVAAAPALAVSYSSDFDFDDLGSLPSPWSLSTPWGTWAPGPLSAEVAASPTGGQALKLHFGTEWASYGGSSGEVDLTLDMNGIDLSTASFHAEYDYYVNDDRLWLVFGEQSSFSPGGIHMNDAPNTDGWMYVGRDSGDPPDIDNAPLNTWVHVVNDFNAATDEWTTTVSWPGGGGGVFSGTSTNDVAGQYWFGGWAFEVQSPQADNALYIDNITFEVIPEPASLMLLGLGGLALIRRRSV